MERDEEENKLTSKEIAHAIVSAIKMDKRGFIQNLMYGLPTHFRFL